MEQPLRSRLGQIRKSVSAPFDDLVSIDSGESQGFTKISLSDLFVDSRTALFNVERAVSSNLVSVQSVIRWLNGKKNFTGQCCLHAMWACVLTSCPSRHVIVGYTILKVPPEHCGERRSNQKVPNQPSWMVDTEQVPDIAISGLMGAISSRSRRRILPVTRYVGTPQPLEIESTNQSDQIHWANILQWRDCVAFNADVSGAKKLFTHLPVRHLLSVGGELARYDKRINYSLPGPFRRSSVLP